VGDLVGTDGHVDLHPRGHVLPQHFGDAPDGLGAPGGLFDEFHHHDLAVLGAVAQLRGDEDVLGDARIGGGHVAHPVLAVIAPHQALVGPFQDLHRGGLATAAAVHAGDAGDDAVAVHHATHAPGADEQVLAALLGDEETETVRVTDDPPAHQIHLVHQAIAPAPVAQELAVPLHGAQTTTQGLQVLLLCEIEDVRDGLLGEGFARLLQGLHDELAARNGALVALGLLGQIGVFGDAFLLR